MISIASAMQQDAIKELLIFTTTADDAEAAAKKAKELIKAQPWGSVLYFQATAV